MKMVVAIIRRERLPCVQKALKPAKSERVTVLGSRAHPDFRLRLAPRLRVEICTEDDHAEEIVDAVSYETVRRTLKKME